MVRRPVLMLVALLTLQSTAAPRAQSADDIDVLLDQLGRYLIAYEGELSTAIAVEYYEQQEIKVAYLGRGQRLPVERSTTRKLESDIAFLRLPGGASWFGVRDVRTIDKKPVIAGAGRLSEIMSRLARTGAMEEAAKIVAASAQYNLGALRTINMPTTPLEVLHPDHHVQFAFKLAGKDNIEGVSTTKIGFEEFDVPTIINGTDDKPLFIQGTVWVEPGSGRIWRVEMALRRETGVRGRDLIVNRIRVDFALHPELKMLVPKEMTESFIVAGGRGQGRAKYSGFRRFTTSARIVPQP
jgi:hypothetical protein